MDNNYQKLLQFKEMLAEQEAAKVAAARNTGVPAVIPEAGLPAKSPMPRSVAPSEVLPRPGVGGGGVPPMGPGAAIPAAASAIPWYAKLLPYASRAAGVAAAMYPSEIGVGPGEVPAPKDIIGAPQAVQPEASAPMEMPALNIPMSAAKKAPASVSQNNPQQEALQAVPAQQPPKSFEDIELQNAMNNRSLMQRDAVIGQALSELSAAAAGAGAGREIAPSQMNKALLALANQPVEDVVTKRSQQKELLDLDTEKAKADPNSDISKYYRNIVSKLGQTVPGNMSAAQLDKAFPMISAQINRQLASEQNSLRKEEMSQQKEFNNSLKVQATIDKKTDILMKSEDYKMYNQTHAGEALLEAALQGGTNDDKAKAAAAFMNYGKIAQGDNSVLRSEDMKTLSGGLNYTDPKELIAKLRAKAAGRNFTQNELQQMLEVTRIVKKVKQEELQRRLSPIEKTAAAHGYDLSQSIDPGLIRNIKDIATKDKAIENYAKQYNMPYEKAEKILKSRGYGQK